EQTTVDLREAWEPDGVSVLDPAPAQDKNGFVVTAEAAASLGVSKVSDLAAHNGSLILGGPPECPERAFCLIGLEDVYGLSFAEFKALDVGGPLTVAALEGNEIQVGLLFTTDGVIVSKGFVLLDDDQGLQPAENLVPAISTEIVDEYGSDLTDVLNKVSGALTTPGLTEMNKLTGYDGEDPAEVAKEWLDSVGVTS
ncbi:MAG: ABC transporter substrate-binding protein, partial [Acidimicrobiia bacterium]